MSMHREETASARAKQLRREMTACEWKLWRHLRERQMRGHKFRRQIPIGAYTDFACLAQQLVIEVDGEQHSTNQAYDSRRTAFMASCGFRVLRFWNHEIRDELDAVIERIIEQLPPPHPPPQAGEGSSGP